MAKKKSDIDTQKVEEEAVMVVKHQLNKSPYLSTIDIPMNDKTPSWDGNVFLYKTPDDKTKKNIDCRIPAQVKGKVIRKFVTHRKVNYSIKLSDLNNYFTDGGIIFFHVHLSFDFSESCVYYVCLNKLQLQMYINTCTTKQHESISVEMKQFPQENNEITEIFTNFSLHMNQTLPEKKIINLQNNSIRYSCSYKGSMFKEDPLKYFLTTPTTIYAIEPIFGTKIAIAMGQLQSISQQCNSPVYIGQTKFFDNFKSYETLDEIKMIFGKGISIVGKHKTQSISINYTMEGTLSEVIQDLKFFKELFIHKSITINGNEQEFPIDTLPDLQKKKDELDETLNYYTTVKQLFTRLEFKEDINIKELTDDDYQKLNLLIDSLFYNITFKRSEKTIIPEIINIHNYKLAILTVPKTKSECIYANIYDSGFEIEMWEDSCPDEKVVVNQYFILDSNSLDADNMNYEKIANAFNEIPITKTSMIGFSYYCTHLYESYKKTNNDKIKACLTKIINDHNLQDKSKEISDIYNQIVA